MGKNIKTKKQIIFICLMIVSFAFFTTVFAYSSLSNYKPKYGTLTSNVNFRTTASTSSGKIRTLSKGTSVKMLATLDNFYVVQLSNNEVGLISKDYVKTSSTSPKGAKVYTAITKKDFTTKDNINLRRGPGTNFAKVSTLNKNTTVKAIGYIDNWYVVVTNKNIVGCIRKDLLSSVSDSNGNNTSNTTTSSFNMSENEKIVFNLINNARTKAGLKKFSSDSTLFKVARLKSQDMVKKSYFSHSSPTYGSPFKMMQTYGITYKVAGENIAGNPSLEAAVEAWLNSDTHKQNILSNSYNYIGIGVEKSDTYGFVITAMFIR